MTVITGVIHQPESYLHLHWGCLFNTPPWLPTSTTACDTGISSLGKDGNTYKKCKRWEFMLNFIHILLQPTHTLVVPAQVWLSKLEPAAPPPSYALQTPAARSCELKHCIRLRPGKQWSTRLVGGATHPRETEENLDCWAHKLQVNYFLPSHTFFSSCMCVAMLSLKADGVVVKLARSCYQS